MNSIRRRLLVGLVAALTLLFSVGGVVLERAVRRSLVSELDRSLLADFRSNSAGITAGVILADPLAPRRPGPGPANRPLRPGPRRQGPAAFVAPELNSDFLFQAWSEEHTFASEALDGALPSPAPGEKAVPFELIDEHNTETGWVELPDGSSGRALFVRYTPPRRQGPRNAPLPKTRSIELTMARDATGALTTLRNLRRLLALSWVVGIAASFLVVRFALDRGLRPLDALRDSLGAMDAGSLGQRFPTDETPDELRPIVERLNGLLERLERAFERERAFTSDAAHELRTPLAGLSSTLELALRRPRSVDEHVAAARQSLAITHDMQGLVEKLLDLARSGASAFAGTAEPVALAEHLTAHIEALSATTEERGLRWKMDLAETTIELDARALDRILANLCENAARYADNGSTIEVRIEAVENGTSVRIANKATGLPADVAERAFDPFWRADASRTEAALHAGIGLSLSKRLAERMEARLEATLEDEWFEIRLVLPA